MLGTVKRGDQTAMELANMQEKFVLCLMIVNLNIFFSLHWNVKPDTVEWAVSTSERSRLVHPTYACTG